MGTLTLRLPDDLDNRLTRFAKSEDISRSELEKFLLDAERERIMSEMTAAFRVLATNPKARAESLAIAEEFLPLDIESLEISEGRKPGEPLPEESGEGWWK
jgi:hypothetical protein